MVIEIFICQPSNLGLMSKVKCPKCKKIFPSYAQYTKHYAKAHYKAKKSKAGKDKVITGKIPVWAKKRK